MWASVVVARRLSSCGSWASERRLSSCGTRAQLLCGMWDLPGPGLEPVSPALAGGLLTTVPPRKPQCQILRFLFLIIIVITENVIIKDLKLWMVHIYDPQPHSPL